MLDRIFYFASIRKLVVAFGSLFDNIHIQKQAENSQTIQFIKVPFAYGPRQIFLSRHGSEVRESQHTTIEMTLPRMSFEFDGISYDARRKVNAIHAQLKGTESEEKVAFQLAPMPYDISFNLNIYTELMDDSLQIIEQILPYFTPSFNLTIKEIPEMNIVRDVPILLNSVSPSDTFESDYHDRRTINWTLNFTCKGHIYPPIKDRKIVNRIIHSFYADKEFQVKDSSTTLSVFPIDE